MADCRVMTKSVKSQKCTKFTSSCPNNMRSGKVKKYMCVLDACCKYWDDNRKCFELANLTYFDGHNVIFI